MEGIFNNREIATAIWIIILSAFFSTKNYIRASLINFIKSLFQRQILSTFFLMAAYFLISIIFLYYINLWDRSLLKDSIVWFFFSGIIICFNSLTAKKDEKIFKKIIKENLTLVVILEFIMNAYTFSLTWELVLVPILTSIFLLGEYAKSNPKYKSVERVMIAFQIIIGISILASVIYKIILDLKNFWAFETLKSFLLLPLLTILFLPFIYFLVLYSKYELLLISLSVGVQKSDELKKYAKKKILKYCCLNLNKVNMAINNLGPLYLINIKNKEDVEKLIVIYRENYNKSRKIRKGEEQ